MDWRSKRLGENTESSWRSKQPFRPIKDQTLRIRIFLSVLDLCPSCLPVIRFRIGQRRVLQILTSFSSWQVLLSLVSLATAAPVIVDQNDGQHYYMLQLFTAQDAIDRSDQQIAGTSSDSGGYGGSYGGSSYGGGYGGGDFGGGQGGGFDGGTGGHLESSGGYDGGHDFSSSGGGFEGSHGGDDGGQGLSLDGGHNYVHSVPVSEHVEVTKPVAVPVYKHVGNVSFYS